MSYKNFVSHSVIDNNQEQVIDTKDGNNDDTSSKQAEIEYDPRTLYERLQEQKNKKEDEFREATRFSNLVKRVDPEEAAYYKSLSDTQQQLDEDLKLKERQELEEYRRAVEQARAPPTTGDTPATVASSPSTTTKRRKSSFDNVAKPKKNPLGDLVLVKKKREAEDNDDNDNERQHKKTKQQETPSNSTKKDEGLALTATTKAASIGLTSLLAAYDDDSSSESD